MQFVHKYPVASINPFYAPDKISWVRNGDNPIFSNITFFPLSCLH